MADWAREEIEYVWNTVPRIRIGQLRNLKSGLKMKIEEIIEILDWINKNKIYAGNGVEIYFIERENTHIFFILRKHVSEKNRKTSQK
ncbi:MAG: hypothetical protein Ta2E_09300 [Mycoplasmoidaceae bacterium]|nr:MAG: hypothetical protein Ta2E_09300 [Mycoplasmoidaceae bacterium]